MVLSNAQEQSEPVPIGGETSSQVLPDKAGRDGDEIRDAGPQSHTEFKLLLPPTPLEQDRVDELKARMQGPIWRPGEPDFTAHIRLFNGKVVPLARALVRPVDAKDVSEIVLFCLKHSLTWSVKGGGYGIAGWAIAGDIVIDLNLLRQVAIEPPNTSGGFTSLKDILPPPTIRSETGAVTLEQDDQSIVGVKRRLEAEPNAGSPMVASYLRELGPIHQRIDDTPAAQRRRVEDSLVPPAPSPMSRESSADASQSDSGSGSNDTPSTGPSDVLGSTPGTTLNSLSGSSPGGSSRSSPPDDTVGFARLPPGIRRPIAPMRRKDPFGYMTESPAPITQLPPRPQLGVGRPLPSFTASGHNLQPSGDVGRSIPIASGTRLPINPAVFTAFPDLVNPPITEAKPLYPLVYVTFGAGNKQKDVDIYTAAHPLPASYPSGAPATIPYHVPFAAHNAGASAMITTGFGFQSRLRGLSVDNLVECEIVTPDGQILIVNETSHSDLWWALRGAGPAFGIITRYKARAYPVPVVFAGNLIYEFNPSTAPSLIKHFRDCIKSAPRELYANIFLTAGPAEKGSLVVIQICYLGGKEKGAEYLQAIQSWTGGSCLLNEVSEKQFLIQQDSVAQVLRGRAGRHWFMRSTLITSLPDDVINETVLKFANTPLGCTWIFELTGGAVADFEDTCLPATQRKATFTVAALHQWDLFVDDPLCVTAAEDWIVGTLASVSTGGPYPAFLGRSETASRIRAAFGAGETWTRLSAIKQIYDPHARMRFSFWPLDSEGRDLPVGAGDGVGDGREPPERQDAEPISLVDEAGTMEVDSTQP